MKYAFKTRKQCVNIYLLFSSIWMNCYIGSKFSFPIFSWNFIVISIFNILYCLVGFLVFPTILCSSPGSMWISRLSFLKFCFSHFFPECSQYNLASQWSIRNSEVGVYEKLRSFFLHWNVSTSQHVSHKS